MATKGPGVPLGLSETDAIELKDILESTLAESKAILISSSAPDQATITALDKLTNSKLAKVKNVSDEKLFLTHLNAALQSQGFIGLYFDLTYFPFQECLPRNPAEIATLEEKVKETFARSNQFNPVSLTTFSTTPSAPAGPSSKSLGMGSFLNPPIRTVLNMDPVELKYKGTLPPIGTKELGESEYRKVKDLSKTINSKLPIESILERFSHWAITSQLQLTDQAYKIALGAVLPDSFIPIYDHLVSDTRVPFHQMAYLLSKKLGSKKSWKLARAQGRELAMNSSDPPLKVLDEIEQLFHQVEDKDRQQLNEEALLLAEMFLTNRFGETFFAIFSSRMQAEKIDNIADLSILFRNAFVKVANTFEDERTSNKKNAHRLHALEACTLEQTAMHDDVRSILHHMEGRNPDPKQITQPNPASPDNGYYNQAPTMQGPYFQAHHIPNPAPQPPMIVPVILPNNRQSQGQQQSRRNKGNYRLAPDQQYCNQPCNIANHHGHRNRDCTVQTAVPCSYNVRHTLHKAAECFRGKDWHFGAVQKPFTGRPFRNNNGQPGGNQHAPHAAHPQASHHVQAQAPENNMNQIIEAIKQGLSNLSSNA